MRHLYADFIDRVSKPMRYLGGEYQSVVKTGPEIEARVCLAFPDVYDIGMSHLGTKIIYSLLNKDPRIACERAFAPWTDMERELRAHGVPLVSLETQRPLAEFDVVGISLQYELTFTNMLTLLDLGGIALRAVDRAEDAPLVLVGGPTASHPEPVAPFIDAAFIGEAEELLAGMCLAWASLRREIRAGTRTRRDALAELAARYPLYVPALYATEIDDATGMVVVGAPLDPRAPARVSRAMLEDLDRYPFPSDTPVPYAEAVFERASVEIARGCTEGCRFCQAGMIYRPVRERSAASIATSLLGGVDRAGYEETGLTCLSTADFSSITPLVKHLGAELRKRGVSMSVASLRAYGLNEDLLDELALTRIAGLTFAPDAGTQRMRDVVNKNITEAHVEESSRRVFARGWHRLKLYFMIGLPTEDDADVRGIVETGIRMLRIGKGLVGSRAEVTVSVSSHVPKPHTPLQWCAQDPEAEILRKQLVLRDTASTRPDRIGRAQLEPGLKLRHHHSGISFVEGLLARGDRRLADVIESVWRAGARFDGWEELFELERWTVALATHGVDTAAYLGTRPITARLPWDHIDVGLEDGFLLGEYRKALKGRASPPCGKVAGMLIHHTNLADAEPDRRKLVCYDCGVACDLAMMRDDRLVALRALGATERVVRVGAPIVVDDLELIDVSERGGGSPAEMNPQDRDNARKEKVRLAGYVGTGPAYTTYRIRFAKVGRAAFLGHLDLTRLLSRSFRRADLPMAMSRGFSPKPRMVFGPALGLGVSSLGELMDIDLEHAPIGCATWEATDETPRVELTPEEVRDRLGTVCPPGVEILSVAIVRLAGHKLAKHPDPTLGKLVDAVDLVVRPSRGTVDELAALAEGFLAKSTAPITRVDHDAKKPTKTIDVRALVLEVEVVAGEAGDKVCDALDWARGPLLRVRVRATAEGSAKPPEVLAALGIEGQVARLGVIGGALVPTLRERLAARAPTPAPAPSAS
ncbi:MAG: TIGR03960 family B12-binding radical SAM protein [Proteobacteria bacterium]|nr:TIGR03960 family B12-binding radical SAM protein [Pseudomonadota bacterium]